MTCAAHSTSTSHNSCILDLGNSRNKYDHRRILQLSIFWRGLIWKCVRDRCCTLLLSLHVHSYTRVLTAVVNRRKGLNLLLYSSSTAVLLLWH